MQGKWTHKNDRGQVWENMSIKTVLNFLKMGSLLATMGTLPMLEDVTDPRTGVVRKEVKQDILLSAIEAIQERTKKENKSSFHYLDLK